MKKFITFAALSMIHFGCLCQDLSLKRVREVEADSAINSFMIFRKGSARSEWHIDSNKTLNWLFQNTQKNESVKIMSSSDFVLFYSKLDYYDLNIFYYYLEKYNRIIFVKYASTDGQMNENDIKLYDLDDALEARQYILPYLPDIWYMVPQSNFFIALRFSVCQCMTPFFWEDVYYNVSPSIYQVKDSISVSEFSGDTGINRLYQLPDGEKGLDYSIFDFSLSIPIVVGDSWGHENAYNLCKSNFNSILCLEFIRLIEGNSELSHLLK